MRHPSLCECAASSAELSGIIKRHASKGPSQTCTATARSNIPITTNQDSARTITWRATTIYTHCRRSHILSQCRHPALMSSTTTVFQTCPKHKRTTFMHQKMHRTPSHDRPEPVFEKLIISENSRPFENDFFGLFGKVQKTRDKAFANISTLATFF